MSLLSFALVLTAALGVGSAAPPFALNGGAFGEAATGRLPGGPTVIAFLDFTEESSAACAGACPSRSQADAVRSLWVSSKADGLRAVLVDAAPTVHGRTAALPELAARVHAWGLEEFPVVQDGESAALARRYGVTSTPCVFLVDGQGIVRARWDLFVPVSDLALRLEEVRARR